MHPVLARPSPLGRTVSLTAAALLTLVSCRDSSDEFEIHRALDTGQTTWWSEDDGDGGPGGGDGSSSAGDSGSLGDSTPPPALGPEQCDGFDNDQNGQVDDGLPSTPCQLGDDAGTTTCVNGRTVCRQCTPGETREADCGCGITRHDRCNDVGRWLIGACSGCEEEAPVGCNAASACTPGERRIRRCDLCAPGAPCGAQCIGAEEVCTAGCEWQEVSGCAMYDAKCDADMVVYEACGKCGRRKVTCDGCFTQESACQDDGVCTPGEHFLAPCSGDSCAQGAYTSIRCNAQCEWEGTECAGCDVNQPTRTVTYECVPGADCGVRIERQECSASTSRATCDGDPITKGVLRTVVLRDDCPYLDCHPGDTRTTPCTTGLGECGTRIDVCNNSCDWPAIPSDVCVARADSCIPGSVETEQVSCGANTCGATFTRTHTCQAGGCGWNTSDGGGCPVCAVGESTSRSCTTADGRCGTQARSCTGACDWGAWGACEPLPGSCVPGSTNTTPISCGPNSCGATYPKIDTCRADGCGWSTSYGGGCPACDQGESDTTSCTTSDGRCGTSSRSCSGTCDWGAWSTCVARSDSCVPGETQTTPIPCGAGLCGASQTEVSTCRSDGCGWSTSITGSCPSCAAGEQDSQSCTTGTGQCGTRSRVCSGSCDWSSWSACNARPDACNTGDTQLRDCTWACGLPGKQVFTCNGCGWDASSECTPVDQSACSPGDSEVLGPCPMCPSQNQTRSCDAGCHWVTSTCPICG